MTKVGGKVERVIFYLRDLRLPPNRRRNFWNWRSWLISYSASSDWDSASCCCCASDSIVEGVLSEGSGVRDDSRRMDSVESIWVSHSAEVAKISCSAMVKAAVTVVEVIEIGFAVLWSWFDFAVTV